MYELRSTEGSRRLYKEHKLYQKEEEDLKRKLDKYIADNAEEWDIKNTVRNIFGTCRNTPNDICPAIHHSAGCSRSRAR